MFENFRAEVRSRTPFTFISQLFIAAMSLALLTSCQREDKQASTGGTSGTAASADTTRCDRLLTTVLEGLRPDRLGIDSERKATVDTLNQWGVDCAAATPLNEISPATLEMIDKISGPQQVDHLKDPQFSGRDGLHIRTCFLMKRISEFAPSSKDNLDRVVDLFEYVVRNINLENPDPRLPPNTAYAAVFFGTGSAEDRAWVFASILRQMRIDAVILRPKNKPEGLDEKSAAARWLVGVLLDGQVYLFDPRLGMPIPAADDDGKSVTVRKPATLANVKEHDELLRALDLPNKPYPLRAEDLKDPSVEVIGEISFWVPRMGPLQAAMAGKNSAIVYEPLDDYGTQIGALHRAADAGAGNWDKAAVTLWPYPEVATEKFEARTPEQALSFQVKNVPFTTPFEFSQGTDGKLAAIPKSEHQRGRISQLVGDIPGAVGNYTNSLIEEIFGPNSPATQEHKVAHFLAADNAIFWTAICHLEKHDPDAALNTLRKYKRRYSNASRNGTKATGPWTNAAHGFIAQILAGRGSVDEAVKEIEAVPADDPKKDGYELLALRWKKAKGETPEKKDAAPATAADTPAGTSAPTPATPANPPAVTTPATTEPATTEPEKPSAPPETPAEANTSAPKK